MREHWLLDPEIVFLNHGSFGATPRAVLTRQAELREQMEREPVRFFTRELEPLLDEARRELAAFVGAAGEGLAFVPNATAGVNAVLRSLDLDQYDELLVTNQEYNACRNALDYVAGVAGARVTTIDIPFPPRDADSIVAPIVERVTKRTRLLLIDHVTSQTAVVNPVAEVVREMSARGVETLVDGAHAPGMIPLQLEALGAAYYTGNLHKWVCAPKGSAFLWVRADKRRTVRPVAISHGANSPRPDRSRYHLEFDWTGTSDPTPMLCVPDALRFIASLVPGGWPAVMERNRELALRARDILAAALRVEHAVGDRFVGSMAALQLPDGSAERPPALYGDPLQDTLLFDHQIEVPVVPWPEPPSRLLRISAQLYNTEAEYRRLASVLTGLLSAETPGTRR